MTILVTGGAGYIGSHTCVELLNAGHDILVVDNLRNSNSEVFSRISQITGKHFKFYEVDLLDECNLERVFSENHISAVVHFAGSKSVGESVSDPVSYYKNNVTGTITLCSVMERYGVRRIVFSSSATVYGKSNKPPFTEDLPLSATNPYGNTKVMIEQILRDIYAANNSWSIILLRYFNPAGAHFSGQIGEDPNGTPNNLFPYISQVAVGKLKELQIYGNDYDTVDGTGVRDYIHVMDLAHGHLKALEKVMTTPGVEAYNLGTGVGFSVTQIVRAFEDASGVRIPYRVVGRRPGDVAVSVADISKAKNILNWVATRGLKEMCEDTWRWQANFPNGYQ